MLTEAIDNFFKQKLMGLHTALPGKIMAYDDKTATAEIEIGFKYTIALKQPDGTIKRESKKYPLIKDIPVSFPAFNNFHIRPPACEMIGARVLLLACERSIDAWMETGNPENPIDPRIFDISDCIVLGGLGTEKQPIKRIGSADSFEIAYNKTLIEISKEGKIKIKSGDNELLSIISNLIGTLANSKIHDQVGGPWPFLASDITAFNKIKTKIDEMKE